jgi:predicted PurR-regulated permease PerM
MKLKFKDLLKICGSLFLLYLAITHWRDALRAVALVIGASSPLIIGCVIAYLVNIIMASYEKLYFPNSKNVYLNKCRRPVCMLLAFLSLAAVVTLVIWLVVPQLVSAVGVIVAGIPAFIEGVLAQVKAWNILPEDILAYLESIDWQSQISQIVKFVGTGIGSVVEILITAVSSVFDWIVTALISVIFSIYVLASKEKLAEQFHRVCRRYLSEKIIGKMDYTLNVINDCFHRYIVGQCVEAVILGVLCGVGMAILKLPYAMMVGTLVAFTALIPIAGAYIGAGVGAFMILTVDPFKALVFIIFLIILQQLEGNLIYPRVVGSSMGLPGIWVLAAVTIGGGIMGIAGMLLGVPLAAAAYRFLKDDVCSAEDADSGEEVPVETEVQSAENG